MPDLLDKITTEDTAARDEAKAVYPDLIFRAARDEPDDGDAATLRRIMPVLGLEQKHVRADIDAAKETLKAERNAVEAKADLPALSKANAEALEKLEAARKTLEGAQREANFANSRLAATQRSGTDHEARYARSQSPRLSAGLYPVDPAHEPTQTTGGHVEWNLVGVGVADAATA